MQPQPSSPPGPESVVKQSVFEGLFVHALKVPRGGPFAAALREVGYDLARQEPGYPAWVWKQAVAVACRHAYPALPVEHAQRELGRRFIEGFLQTLAGRALGVLLPVFGPESVVQRLPRFITMGVPAARVDVRQEGPSVWRVEVNVPWALADFDAGLIEGGVRRTGTAVDADVLERADHRYVLRLRW